MIFQKLEEEQNNAYYIEMKNKDNLNEIDGQIKKNNNTKQLSTDSDSEEMMLL